MADLKPCPFCGSKPFLEADSCGGETGYLVLCTARDCKVSPSTYLCETREQAIAAWNNRSERTCQQIDTTEKYQPYVTHSTVCSLCGEMLALEEFPAPNYCPSCGAKVVVEE